MPGAGADRNDDDSLVACVRAGDDRAFEQLYLRYQRRIAAYVYGMVHDHQRAEDITQDVFISALRRMRATDARLAFKPWIYEIAKNACIDAFRRSKRAEEVSYDVEDGAERLHLTSNGPTPDAAVDTRMSLDHLRGAFGGLSEAHHQILVMRELEGLSYRQIGERLGMSRPSVESTLFRARRRLSEEYEELVSGERCRRIQGIIAGATGGQVGTRDERKMARHVSHCQPCRRAALVAGFDADALMPKRTVREKIAALLPVPAFLKRWVAGGDGGLLSTAAHYADPASGGWVKLAAAASALALAGLGAHEVTTKGGDKHDASGSPTAAAPVRSAAPAAARGGVTPHGAAGATHTIVSRTSKKAHRTNSTVSTHTTTTGGGAGASTPSGSNAGGGSSSSSSSTPAGAAGTNGGSSGSDPAGDATRSVDDAVGGATGSVPDVPTVQLPTVQVPNLPGAPKVVNDTVDTVNGVVAGATGTVNQTVGQVTTTVNTTVGQTTTTVNQTVGGVTGTLQGVTGGTGKLLGGG
jgi:RNA polymerase sigma factor (sigma-70 family)